MTSRIRYRNMIHFESNNPQLKSSRQQQMVLKKTNQHIVLSVYSFFPVKKIQVSLKDIGTWQARAHLPSSRPTMLAGPWCRNPNHLLSGDCRAVNKPTWALDSPTGFNCCTKDTSDTSVTPTSVKVVLVEGCGLSKPASQVLQSAASYY